MTEKDIAMIAEIFGTLYKPHPWHGLPIGNEFPEIVNVYIEIVPTDTMKYEMDKRTGHLKIDRPQRFSNFCPAPYGFIPQTFCDEKVGEFCGLKINRKGMKGDGDPLDICVLTEKDLNQGGITLTANPIGGLRMIDGDEADDKIIAVLKDDAVYGRYQDISECPPQVVERLKHYFLTYKEIPNALKKTKTQITDVYGRFEAFEIINRSYSDYINKFGKVHELLKNIT